MDHFDPGSLRPDQCRARAEFIRDTANAMSAKDLRQKLLDVAEQYERLAERLETRLGTDAA